MILYYQSTELVYGSSDSKCLLFSWFFRIRQAVELMNCSYVTNTPGAPHTSLQQESLTLSVHAAHDNCPLTDLGTLPLGNFGNYEALHVVYRLATTESPPQLSCLSAPAETAGKGISMDQQQP
jgi:hypothetical protein